MDKNGDGVVTPDEFVEHAAAQEACDGGACAADEATHAKLRESAEEEAAGELPTVTPDEFVEHAAAQEACDGGACAADEATHAKLRESAEEEAAGEMPTVTPEQIAAMQADIAAQLASGKSVKMTTENSPAVLSGSHNLMIKFSTSW
jgi:hypothetical protein